MQTFESLALLKVEIEKFELVHTEPANRLSHAEGDAGEGGREGKESLHASHCSSSILHPKSGHQ